LVVGLLCTAVSCSLLNPLDGFSGGDPAVSPGPLEAGTPDTGPDAGNDPCLSARPPSRPPPTTTTDGGSTVVAALSAFSFADPGNPNAANTRGYDLDRLCTCPPSCAESRTCVVSEERSARRACAPKAKTICDLARGVDNSAGDLMLSLTTLRLQAITPRLDTGQDGLLFEIKDYNGEPDDSSVEFGLLDSYGTDETQADAGPANLKRDGTDRWTFDPATRTERGRFDRNAYVSGGVLVATIGTTIRVGLLVFPLSDGIVSAKLVKRPNGVYALEDGILSGRMRVEELLRSFEVIPNGKIGYFCGKDPYFAGLRDTLCAARDLPTDPSLDGADAPCTGLSLAVRFTADPAALGNFVAAPARPRPCGVDWQPKCD
jgi:hypothetical protein